MKKICPNCGSVFESSNFCTKCGHKLIEDVETDYDSTNDDGNFGIEEDIEKLSEESDLIYKDDVFENSEEFEKKREEGSEDLYDVKINVFNEQSEGETENQIENKAEYSKASSQRIYPKVELHTDINENYVEYDNDSNQPKNNNNSNVVDNEKSLSNSKKVLIIVLSVCIGVAVIAIIGVFVFSSFMYGINKKISHESVVEMENSSVESIENENSETEEFVDKEKMLENYTPVTVEMSDNYKPDFDIAYVQTFDADSIYNNLSVKEIVSILNKRSKALGIMGYAEAESNYIKYYSSDELYGSAQYRNIFNGGEVQVIDINGKVVLKNSDIASVTVSKTDNKNVIINLTKAAAYKFADYTEKNERMLLEVYLGDELYSSKIINEPVYNGAFEPDSFKSAESAKLFSAVVNSGQFKEVISLNYGEYNEISPAKDFIDENTGHRYEFIIADLSWSDAFADCIERGGNMVMFDSVGEYENVVVNLAKTDYQNIKFWIGATREYGSDEYRWVNQYNTEEDYGGLGSSVINKNSYYSSYWLNGEPNFYYDGVEEDCLNMFYYKKEARWVLNDTPNDILAVVPSYKGCIGYICEYEE